ncbi:MAG: M81 family metallopeptidase [Pseudomonadota bacterium]
MPRIAIAGFQHETNTFVPNKTTFRDFQIADSWPEMLLGPEVVTGTHGMNLPIAGFVQAAGEVPSVDLHPILWTAAEPAAHVTDDAFERITRMILEGLDQTLDGVYLDLHGAMVTESVEDGEGEVLRLVRDMVGPDIPIAISLDLHANLTPGMVELADVICVYRTYPHLDMADTGARCFPLLMDLISGVRFAKAFRQAPFLIPLHAQFTGADPCRSLYDLLPQIGDAMADIALGFTASDIWHAGPSVVAYGQSQDQADTTADQLLSAVLAAEDQFETGLLSPTDAVRKAMENTDPRPVVIADVQDNAGAGGTSDTTGLLSALVAEGATRAVLGLLHDPDMAAEAHAAGVGGVIQGPLGGKSGMDGQEAFDGRFRVEAVGDGQCTYTGEMYGGGIAVLGPSAILRVLDTPADVRVVISSQRSQCLDRALFTHIGVDLADARIIAVKSTVHFRADFDPIASDTLMTAAPGGFICDLKAVPYQRLRPGLRLGPMGPVWSGGTKMA